MHALRSSLRSASSVPMDSGSEISFGLAILISVPSRVSPCPAILASGHMRWISLSTSFPARLCLRASDLALSFLRGAITLPGRCCGSPEIDGMQVCLTRGGHSEAKTLPSSLPSEMPKAPARICTHDARRRAHATTPSRQRLNYSSITQNTAFSRRLEPAARRRLRDVLLRGHDLLGVALGLVAGILHAFTRM